MKYLTLSEIYDLLFEGNYSAAVEQLRLLNDAYRKGDPKISDPEWDKIYEDVRSFVPDDDFFKSAVIEEVIVNPERMEKLIYPMYSLNKLTTIEEIQKKIASKGLPPNILVVVLSKYDGCSALNYEQGPSCWSRGDGVEGQRLMEHYKKVGQNGQKLKANLYTIGELIIAKKTFADNQHLMIKKDGTPYKNPRNMVAGLINDDNASDYWKYVTHIRYGIADADANFTMDKLEQLKLIPEIPYLAIPANELTEELLDGLYYKWGEDWEIDGLVIDINDKNIRKSLGRETNDNPAYAWAYKKGWTKPTTTPLISEEWNLGKKGFMAPVINIQPVEVEGVTVSRATAYNARFVLENGIGTGAIVDIIRSGSVIPKIVNVRKRGAVSLPTHCPSCNHELVWSTNTKGEHVNLMCINPDCEEIKFKMAAFFFTSFKLKDFGEGTAKILFNNGFDSVNKILNMTIDDLKKINGLGNVSGTKFLKEISTKIRKCTFERIGHASGCFENLGSRKLKMILDGIGLSYIELASKISTSNGVELLNFQNNLLSIKGVSDRTAAAFMDGLAEFKEFIKDIDVEIVDVVEDAESDAPDAVVLKPQDMTGRAFLFSGFRDANLEKYIVKNGGEIKSSYSTKVTDLLLADINSSSKKTNDAKANGCTITQIDDFRKSLSV